MDKPNSGLVNPQGGDLVAKVMIATSTMSTAIDGPRQLRRDFKRKWIDAVVKKQDPRIQVKTREKLETMGAVKIELQLPGGKFQTSYYEIKEVEMEDPKGHDGKIDGEKPPAEA